jgi:hypothetical protein
MPEQVWRGLKRASLVVALAVGGCAHGSGLGGMTAENDPDINVLPANYKPDIVAAMHAYLTDPTGIRDAGIGTPALKTVGGNLRYVVCVRFNARKRGTEYAGPKEVSAVFVAGRFDRFAEIPKGEHDDERARCAGAAYAAFPELEKLSR